MGFLSQIQTKKDETEQSNAQYKNKNDIAKMVGFDLDFVIDDLIVNASLAHLPAHVFESKEVGKRKRL